MVDTIFQSSDLATRRTEFLDAARQGEARLRDKDGASFVMLPERRLHLLERLAEWSQHLMRLEGLLRSGVTPRVSELGELAWLRVFDLGDMQEFARELQDAMFAAYADGDTAVLDDCLTSWRITARQLADPLRRSVLHASHRPEDFVEVAAPDDDN
jgi:hypothetical protein